MRFESGRGGYGHTLLRRSGSGHVGVRKNCSLGNKMQLKSFSVTESKMLDVQQCI